MIAPARQTSHQYRTKIINNSRPIFSYPRLELTILCLARDCCLVLNDFEKNYCAANGGRSTTVLGDLSQVIGEFIFFDDEKTISIRLD